MAADIVEVKSEEVVEVSKVIRWVVTSLRRCPSHHRSHG